MLMSYLIVQVRYRTQKRTNMITISALTYHRKEERKGRRDGEIVELIVADDELDCSCDELASMTQVAIFHYRDLIARPSRLPLDCRARLIPGPGAGPSTWVQ